MTRAPGELVELAKVTVQAARAALEWLGPDHRGVLEHVAAASPDDMASSRTAYELFRSGAQLVNFSGFEVDRLEMAALPATAVPTWASVVNEAQIAALASLNKVRPPMSVNTGMLIPTEDRPAGPIHKAHLRYSALLMCGLWGGDPLQPKAIHYLAEKIVRRAPEIAQMLSLHGLEGV
jgi:hypothetical protein